MEGNNSFKTIMWIIGLLVVVGIIVFLVTKDKEKDYSDENMVIGEAVVEDFDILMLESFPVQINLAVKGYTPDACTQVGDVKQLYANGVFSVTLESKRPLDEQCAQQIMPFEKTISLSGVVGLPRGEYIVDLNGMRKTFTLDIDNFISDEDPLK